MEVYLCMNIQYEDASLYTGFESNGFQVSVCMDKNEPRHFGVATFIEGALTTLLRFCILR